MTAGAGWFAQGGIFMYINAAHLVVWLGLSSIFLAAVAVRAFRIRSRARAFEAACRARNVQAALEAARKKPADPMGRAVGLCAGQLADGREPEQAAGSAFASVLQELPGLHPFWTVGCCLAFVCSIPVSLFHGSLGEHAGLVQMFGALAQAVPDQRAELLAMAADMARIPAYFSIAVAVLAGFPAVLSALLLATAASSGRERKAALSLVADLTGTGMKTSNGSTAAVASGIVFFFLCALAGMWAVLPSGAPRLMESVLAQAAPEPPSPPADAIFGGTVVDEEPPEEPGLPDPGESEDEETGGRLDPSSIKAVVGKHLDETRYCYEKELAKNPNLRGKVVVSFTITTTGKVTDVTVKDSELGSRNVEDCLIKAIGRWTFPKPEGGSVKVSYPLIFTSSSP